MRAKLSLVGRDRRNQAGSRGRGKGGLTGFETAILLFQFRPEFGELVRAEVGEDFAIHINDGCQFLSGKLDHFVVSSLIGNDVDRLIIDAVLVKPAFGFVAPAAVRFDEQTDPFNIHRATVAEMGWFFKSVVGGRQNCGVDKQSVSDGADVRVIALLRARYLF